MNSMQCNSQIVSAHVGLALKKKRFSFIKKFCNLFHDEIFHPIVCMDEHNTFLDCSMTCSFLGSFIIIFQTKMFSANTETQVTVPFLPPSLISRCRQTNHDSDFYPVPIYSSIHIHYLILFELQYMYRTEHC